ncbi:MAG: hypothetical protein N4A74_23900 [Carboxylicivirga sp.]|jgi:tetratricopeptide (TPR) repeat protein|nr:hypothetical protein [Carboxylicivirga sp.]
MKRFLLSLALGLSIVLINAQKYEERGDKYLKYDNYAKARKDFLRELRKDKENVNLLKKVIECFLKDNTLREEALPYTERLLEIKPNDAEAHISKAIALFHGHRFDDALNALKPIAPNSSLKSEAEKLKQQISNAKKLTANPINVEFINLGGHINTSRNEISPYVSKNEHTLFYASDKRYNSYAGIYYFNVCVSEIDQLSLQKGKTIGSQVNTIYDEMVAGITPDGSQLFVFHNRDNDEAMGFAKYKGKYRFDPLENFGPPLDARGSEYGMWMTNERDTIIFSSESESGNTDLYYAIKLPTGFWGEARLLPGKLNSVDNENFPVLSHDGKRLYFSSDNEKSMGGYDLFYSDWDETTKGWSAPVNLGYPINDMYDNFNISWVDGRRHAYVSAIRPEGHGGRDIYRLVFDHTKPPYNAILKCDIRVKKDRKTLIPDFEPSISVTDTLNNLIGTYKAQQDSADFILALTPGHYRIKIEHESIEPLIHPLVVPDKHFDIIAKPLRLIVIAKPENNTK